MAAIGSDTPSGSLGLGSLADERLGAVVETMAGREPLPAAGAALAITLSMAAALIEKATSAPRHGQAVDAEALGLAGHLRRRAVALADEDSASYRRVVAAKGDAARMRAALSHAADPPLAIAEVGVRLARLAAGVLDVVPLSLQGEVRAAGHLACSAAAAASELASIDLADDAADERCGRAAELRAAAAACGQALAARALRA